MALYKLGSFKGAITTNENLVENFKQTAKEKFPTYTFSSVKKVAIEAPAGTRLQIESVDITMPSTGIFELGLDYVEINSIVFLDDAEVNIVYLY